MKVSVKDKNIIKFESCSWNNVHMYVWYVDSCSKDIIEYIEDISIYFLKNNRSRMKTRGRWEDEKKIEKV